MAGTSRDANEMDFMIGKHRSLTKPTDDSPFRILVLAPLSGGHRKTASAKPFRVDTTELDALIERIAPAATLDMADGSHIEISIEALEDFHPDALYDRLAVFRALRHLRRELQDPSTFPRAAAALRGVPEPTSSGAPGEAPKSSASGLDAFVRQLVASHLSQSHHPGPKAHLSALDRATGELMRSILHHPTFQALEAAWRGLDFLLREVEVEMEMAVLNTSKDDIEAALSVDDPCVSSLGKCLIGDVGAPEPPWALVVGAFTFGPNEADAALMGRLAALLAVAGVPLLSAAEPSLASQDAPPDWSSWKALRQRPEAAMVGLALPRFMLRLPYGKRTDAVNRFAFEEQTLPPDPARYLWGNAAFFVAALLGRSFARNGWNMSVDEDLSIHGLPVHTVQVDGESAQTPCAEVWMSQGVTDALIAQGLVPLCSVPASDAVQLPRIQSLADPSAPLAGRWQIP